MKYLLTLLLLFSLNVYSEEQSCEQLLKDGGTPEQIVQRGCCSHHQGVCGCDGGRTVCCDGQLSPSCNCHIDDVKFYEKNESELPKG